MTTLLGDVIPITDYPPMIRGTLRLILQLKDSFLSCFNLVEEYRDALLQCQRSCGRDLVVYKLTHGLADIKRLRDDLESLEAQARGLALRNSNLRDYLLQQYAKVDENGVSHFPIEVLSRIASDQREANQKGQHQGFALVGNVLPPPISAPDNVERALHGGLEYYNNTINVNQLDIPAEIDLATSTTENGTRLLPVVEFYRGLYFLQMHFQIVMCQAANYALPVVTRQMGIAERAFAWPSMPNYGLATASGTMRDRLLEIETDVVQLASRLQGCLALVRAKLAQDKRIEAYYFQHSAAQENLRRNLLRGLQNQRTYIDCLETQNDRLAGLATKLDPSFVKNAQFDELTGPAPPISYSATDPTMNELNQNGMRTSVNLTKTENNMAQLDKTWEPATDATGSEHLKTFNIKAGAPDGFGQDGSDASPIAQSAEVHEEQPAKPEQAPQPPPAPAPVSAPAPAPVSDPAPAPAPPPVEPQAQSSTEAPKQSIPPDSSAPASTDSGPKVSPAGSNLEVPQQPDQPAPNEAGPLDAQESHESEDAAAPDANVSASSSGRNPTALFGRISSKAQQLLTGKVKPPSYSATQVPTTPQIDLEDPTKMKKYRPSAVDNLLIGIDSVATGGAGMLLDFAEPQGSSLFNYEHYESGAFGSRRSVKSQKLFQSQDVKNAGPYLRTPSGQSLQADSIETVHPVMGPHPVTVISQFSEDTLKESSKPSKNQSNAFQDKTFSSASELDDTFDPTDSAMTSTRRTHRTGKNYDTNVNASGSRFPRIDSKPEKSLHKPSRSVSVSAIRTGTATNHKYFPNRFPHRRLEHNNDGCVDCSEQETIDDEDIWPVIQHANHNRYVEQPQYQSSVRHVPEVGSTGCGSACIPDWLRRSSSKTSRADDLLNEPKRSALNRALITHRCRLVETILQADEERLEELITLLLRK